MFCPVLCVLYYLIYHDKNYYAPVKNHELIIYFMLHTTSLVSEDLALFDDTAKKDANHILIPQVICFFISVPK